MSRGGGWAPGRREHGPWAKEEEAIDAPAGGWGERPPKVTVTDPLGHVSGREGSFLALWWDPDAKGWHIHFPTEGEESAYLLEVMAQVAATLTSVAIDAGMGPAFVRDLLAAALDGVEKVARDRFGP